jgi:hypothetical protein
MKPSVISLVLLLGAVSTTTTPKSVDLTAGLSDTEAAQLLRFYPWAREAQACALGEYTVTAPAADPGPIIHLQKRNGEPFLFVDRHPPGMPGAAREGRVLVNLFKNGKVSVWDDGSSVTISETANAKLKNPIRVVVSDFDGDGLYDRLTYNAFDKEGHVSASVMDFDLDGQPDFKIKSAGGKTESYAWVEERWRLIEKRDGKAGVLSETGTWRPIKRQGGTWRYVE